MCENLGRQEIACSCPSYYIGQSASQIQQSDSKAIAVSKTSYSERQ